MTRFALAASGLRKLALPMLSMLFVSLTGAPSAAQGPIPLASKRTPGQVVETIGRAATVVETVPYQATLELTCANLTCSGDFPTPGARRQLNIMRITCLMGGSGGSTYSTGEIGLISEGAPQFQYQYLPLGHSADHDAIGFTFHTVNTAVDMHVATRQRLRVKLYLGSGTTKVANCSASGTLDRLQ